MMTLASVFSPAFRSVRMHASEDFFFAVTTYLYLDSASLRKAEVFQRA